MRGPRYTDVLSAFEAVAWLEIELLGQNRMAIAGARDPDEALSGAAIETLERLVSVQMEIAEMKTLLTFGLTTTALEFMDTGRAWIRVLRAIEPEEYPSMDAVTDAILVLTPLEEWHPELRQEHPKR